jgi:hypothetical protein
MMGFSFLDFMTRVFAPLALPVALSVAVLAVGRSFVDDGPWVLVVAAVASTSFLCAWAFTATARELRHTLRPRPVHGV